MSHRAFWLLLCLLMLAPWAQAGTRYYYYTDPQGTPLTKADAQGNIVERYEYTPYGVPVPGVGAAPNGPGYTGHVNDPESGLVYMQARYYDPAVGRFLSRDPVIPSPGNLFTIGRYGYANNNPAKFVDPDGRTIITVLRNATISDSTTTMDYLAESTAARHEIHQLETSNKTYTIIFDRNTKNMSYNDQTRTVIVNPTSGLVIRSSGAIQSPALGAGHEISHAAEHDRVGTKTFQKNLVTPVISIENTPGGGMSVVYGIAPEENRATMVESKIAQDLGEAQRKNYNDSQGTVITCSPTSAKEC